MKKRGRSSSNTWISFKTQRFTSPDVSRRFTNSLKITQVHSNLESKTLKLLFSHRYTINSTTFLSIFSSSSIVRWKLLNRVPLFTEIAELVIPKAFYLSEKYNIVSERQELIRATLSALHAYLSWIALVYIFESPLLDTLLKFLPIRAYRNITLQFLSEITPFSVFFSQIALSFSCD